MSQPPTSAGTRDATNTIETGKRRSLMRFAPLALLLAAIVFVVQMGWHEYLAPDRFFATLSENYVTLTGFVAENLVLSVLAFMGVYIIATALSLPGAGILSILGGLLFGVWIGTAAVVVAATIGATLIFLIAKSAVGDFLQRRAKGFVKKVEEGFKENAFSYLLLLRLIPAVPFFVLNILPSIFNMPLRTYVLATFIGIIPGSIAYVSAGNGAGAIIRAGGEVNLSGLLLQPAVLFPIIALAVLAMIPVIYKTVTGNKSPVAAAPAQE